MPRTSPPRPLPRSMRAARLRRASARQFRRRQDAEDRRLRLNFQQFHSIGKISAWWFWCSCRWRGYRRLGAHVDLSTALGVWKNLPGIQQRIRIEHVVNAFHQAQIGLAEKQWHQPVFLHSHAMLARDRTAHLYAELDDFVRRPHRVAKLFFIPLVEKNDRMQVAIARMKYVA